MTVTYTADIATCGTYGCFLRLIARWRGSIYKLIWMDLLVFLLLYYLLSFIYIFALSHDQKRIFENIVEYCNWNGSLIPISFVLGFYVAVVMKRWWDQYLYIPWPDSIAVFVSAHVPGSDEVSRIIRRTVMRYVCLCLTITLASMSPRVKKRFPTWDQFVTAGLLQESEKQIIERLDEKFPAYPKHWMPIVWSASIVIRARNEGRIRDDCAVKTIVDELNKFRGRCGMLLYYDFISVPLVYTQVVTLAVYSYFLSSLMGKQWLEIADSKNNLSNSYFPLFTTLQFFFYMGWLKVAESLINPFGNNDDDFEVNWLLDRNINVSYLIVDEMHYEHPELVKDQYWDEVFPTELPYAEVGGAKREEPPEPSTARVAIYTAPSPVQTEESRSTGVTFLKTRRTASFDRISFMSSNSEITSSSSYSSGGTKRIGVVFPTRREEGKEYRVSGNISDDSLSDFDRLKTRRETLRLERRKKSFARATRYYSTAHLGSVRFLDSKLNATQPDYSEALQGREKESNTEKRSSNERDAMRQLNRQDNRPVLEVPQEEGREVDEERNGSDDDATRQLDQQEFQSAQSDESSVYQEPSEGSIKSKDSLKKDQ